MHRPKPHKQGSDGKVQTREHGGFPIGADVMTYRGGDAFAAAGGVSCAAAGGAIFTMGGAISAGFTGAAGDTGVRVNMALGRARIEAILCKAAVAAA